MAGLMGSSLGETTSYDMKKSHMLKKCSAIVGVLGILALFLAWWAESHGFILGFESRVWYNNAVVFLLVAIWFKLGAIYHKGEN